MPFFSNTQLPLEGVANWLTTSNINDPLFLFNSNIPCHDFIAESCLSNASIFQNPPSRFSLEPSRVSIYETDNYFSSNHCLSHSSLQTFSCHSSVKNSSSCYSFASLNSPKSNHPLDQTGQVHSFPHLAFSPSEMISQTPSNLDQCRPLSSCLFHSSSQYPSKQAVVHDTNNLDVSTKHFSGSFNNQPWPDINRWSSFRNETVLQPDDNTGANSFNGNATNIDALWHRFYQAAAPTEYFHEPNKQNAGGLQTIVSQPHAGGADFHPANTLLKRKIPEGGDKGEEQSKKSNSHQCRLCNMSFSTGNALGGHMSYHAKKKKLKQTLVSKQPRI